LPPEEQQRWQTRLGSLPPWWPVAVLGALAAAVLLWAWHGGPVPPLRTGSPQAGTVHTERLPLSPQECVTECQARQTDCIQECDGHIPCERACVSTGTECVARCRQPGDAGAKPPAATPAPR
jgi:hypothetical protein